MSSEGLPGNTSKWLLEAQQLGLVGKSIHEYGLASSGSKIERTQFLLLYILWLDKEGKDLESKYKDNKYMHEAMSFLYEGEIKGIWSNYLKSINEPLRYIMLGAFSLVRYHQRQTMFWKFLKGDTPSKVDFSPVASRTRSQANKIQTEPKTPTRASKESSLENTFKLLHIRDPPSEPPAAPSSKTPSSSPSTPPGQRDTYHPPGARFGAIEDEQIVNTALIEYLNALAIHYPKLEADWTLHRLPLTARNNAGQKTYEARTDGYLKRRSDGAPLVILEVKPHRRTPKKNETRMQEAAQMAAWISQYPPRNLESMRANKLKDERLLISQDKDEIFLTFAEFDASYVDYICHQRPDSSSHLTMNEYGPFQVSSESAMKQLGQLVLGLVLYYCEHGNFGSSR
ncbi:hypothetical protein F5Y12DRAFT_664252 [Xylaria sp. FL1777]|nr:hypothetical protein F5Y12DRAFT_664252 [Xylaria sp. FL1777]